MTSWLIIRMQPDALLVPERAIAELQGGYQIGVVGPDNKVTIRTVKIGDPFGSERIVTEGLNPGERVVAEGIQKLRPGMQVNPRPFTAIAAR